MARPQPLAPAEARLDRARVADQIIARLQAKIANGSYPRGSKLPTERVLAATYGVSAPTIREALRALTSMGLVQVRHGSGAYVAENSDGLIDSALATLAAIEDVTMLENGVPRFLRRICSPAAAERVVRIPRARRRPDRDRQQL